MVTILLRLFLLLGQDDGLPTDEVGVSSLPTVVDITDESEIFEIDPD